MTITKDAYRHNMKTGDRLPSIRRKLASAETSQPLDLTGATARFIMMDVDGNVKVNASAIVESPETDGTIRYDWAAGDTSEDGTFEAEFQITFSTGEVYTMPNDGHIIVEITEQLGS